MVQKECITQIGRPLSTLLELFDSVSDKITAQKIYEERVFDYMNNQVIKYKIRNFEEVTLDDEPGKV